MTYEFMSNGWAKAYQDILNPPAAYRDAAANWEGDFFVCLPLETTSTPLCAYLDLWHGECREAARDRSSGAKTGICHQRHLARVARCLERQARPDQGADVAAAQTARQHD